MTITATASIIPGTSVHRFLISSLDLRIDAAKRSKQGQSLQPKGGRHYAAAGECRMGRDFGRRSRPWLREREGPAAQRWEGKHRRCAPVRSPCPKAESAAGTLSTRHKKKSPDSSLNRDSRSAAATYSPTWCSSTIGASELNFSVRDGKRWILTAITAAI